MAIWNTTTGALKQTLPAPEERLAAVTFAPDGKTLLTGTEEGEVQLWHLASGKVLRAFRDSKREEPLVYLFLVFSPDGRYVAIGDVYNSTVLLWDPATGKVVRQLEGIAEPYCAAFSPDGKVLATGDGGHLIRLWEVATGKEKHPFTQPNGTSGPVALSPDGNTLAACNWDGTVYLWNFPEGTPLRTLPRGAGQVPCLAFSPRGGLLVTGTSDGMLHFWDPATGKEQRQLQAHWEVENQMKKPGPVEAVAFSPDGKTLASGGFDSTVRLWDVSTGRLLHTLRDRKGWVFAVAFSPDGSILAGGGATDDSMATCLWDAKTGKLIRKMEEDEPGGFAMTLALSRDGKELVSAGELLGFWKIDFMKVATGEGLAHFDNLQSKTPNAYFAAALSPDGHTLALGSVRGITLFDMATRKEIRTIRGPFGACSSLVFSPGGQTLVAAHEDGTVLFWDLRRKGMESRTGYGNPLRARP